MFVGRFKGEQRSAAFVASGILEGAFPKGGLLTAQEALVRTRALDKARTEAEANLPPSSAAILDANERELVDLFSAECSKVVLHHDKKALEIENYNFDVDWRNAESEVEAIRIANENSRKIEIEKSRDVLSTCRNQYLEADRSFRSFIQKNAIDREVSYKPGLVPASIIVFAFAIEFCFTSALMIKRLLAAVFVVPFAFVVALVFSGPTINEQTLCPIDSNKIPRHTYFIVDVTDVRPAGVDGAAIDKLMEKFGYLEKFEKVTLYALSDDVRTSLQSKFSMCNPGNQELGQVSALLQNPSRVNLDYNARFKQAFYPIVRNIIEGTSNKPRTPLVEFLMNLLSGEAVRAAPGKVRVVIFSNFLQYSNNNDPTYGGVQLTNVRINDAMASSFSNWLNQRFGGSDLTGVNFELISVPTSDSPETPHRLMEAWKAGLTSRGAEVEWAVLSQ